MVRSFSAELKNRVVTLKTARDVARLSFIVRNSISYLDLDFGQYSMVSNYVNICNCCAGKLSNSFISTEEKCRKFFTRSRNLLYTLHLDLPKGRECNLKDVPKFNLCENNPDIPHISKIIPTCGFDISILSDFLGDALNKNVAKTKLLVWILKTRFSDYPLLYMLEIQIANKFIDCFYPDKTDSTMFKDFIMQFDFMGWILRYEEPEILEFLLYYARHYGRKDLNEDCFTIDELIDPCIFNRSFSNIGPILKYINSPTFDEDYYLEYFTYISCVRRNLTLTVLYEAERWLEEKRVHQMLQFIFMYFFSDQLRTADASEALRLIWCSIPDAYISFKEIKMVFDGVFSAEELRNMYSFYATAVGDFYHCVEPRSLQHLCRSIIRKTLRENQIWIPEGLKQTGLPKSLLPFLNLEKGIYRI